MIFLLESARLVHCLLVSLKSASSSGVSSKEFAGLYGKIPLHRPMHLKWLQVVIVIILVMTAVRVWKNKWYNYGQFELRNFCPLNNYVGGKPKVELWSLYRAKLGYITFSMTTLRYRGGIGNRLFEYASLLGIGRTLGRIPFFNVDDPPVVAELGFMQERFPALAEKFYLRSIDKSSASLFWINRKTCCRYWPVSLLACDTSESLIVDGDYFQSYKYFRGIESDLKSLLAPIPERREVAQKFFNAEQSGRFKQCVHVRRGDFTTDGHHQGTDPNFVVKALRFLVDHHADRHVHVVVFNNNPTWVEQEILSQSLPPFHITVLHTADADAMFDLSLSQTWCDSLLITAPSSTFGWWLGYLSRNSSNVFYRDIAETSDKVQYEMRQEDFFPPSWTKLRTNADGSVSS